MLLIQSFHLINNPTDLGGNYSQIGAGRSVRYMEHALHSPADEARRLCYTPAAVHRVWEALNIFTAWVTTQAKRKTRPPNPVKLLWRLPQLFKWKGIRKPWRSIRCFKAIHWKREEPGQRAKASQAFSNPFSVILPQLK